LKWKFWRRCQSRKRQRAKERLDEVEWEMQKEAMRLERERQKRGCLGRV